MRQFIKSLLPYIRPYKKTALLAVFLSLPLSAIKGAEIWLIKHVIDILAPGSSYQDAVKIAGALLFLGLLNFPARFFHFYLIRYVVDKSTCLIRDDLYLKLQKLPLSFFSKNKSGALVSNILNDSLVFSQGFRSAIDLIREPLTALVMLGVAVYTDWKLTLIIFLVGPLFVLIFVKSGKKVKKSQEEVQEYMAHMTHNVSEGVNGQKITKAFNLQKYVMGRFQKAQDLFFKFQMKTTLVEEMAHPLVEFVGSIAFAGVILFAYHRIQTGEMTLGDLIQFIGAMALIMDPLRKYSQANVKVNQAQAASERIFEIMKLAEEVDEGTIELKEFRDKIEFKNISFWYDFDETEENKSPIIKNLNLTIKKGERVGIVGLSGAGKSTLINLILRLYPLQEGEIRIDGISIAKYTLPSLRKIFGLVSQDIFLFHDSIEENINIGSAYSEEQIKNALITAGAREFVSELEDGVHTVIGDRGTKLSGGQGQRITIARAVLQNPSILLFDEATSALDHSSEKVVQEALDRWSTTKTVLAVAHRLSTIQNYDKIVVMRRGEIVESGTHLELLNMRGEYGKLYELAQQGHSLKKDQDLQTKNHPL